MTAERERRRGSIPRIRGGGDRDELMTAAAAAASPSWRGRRPRWRRGERRRGNKREGERARTPSFSGERRGLILSCCFYSAGLEFACGLKTAKASTTLNISPMRIIAQNGSMAHIVKKIFIS